MTDEPLDLSYLRKKYQPFAHKHHMWMNLNHGFFGIGKTSAVEAIKEIDVAMNAFVRSDLEVSLLGYNHASWVPMAMHADMDSGLLQAVIQKDGIDGIKAYNREKEISWKSYDHLVELEKDISFITSPYGIIVRPSEENEFDYPDEIDQVYRPFIALYEPGKFGQCLIVVSGMTNEELKYGVEAVLPATQNSNLKVMIRDGIVRLEER